MKLRIKRKKREAGRPSKWDNRMYVDIYRLAMEGLSDNKIGKRLGVSTVTFQNWKDSIPTELGQPDGEVIRDALKKGREAPKATEDTTEHFHEFVYGRLPENLKGLWREIGLSERGKSTQYRVESLLKAAGVRARQHLFLYAFTACNFNATAACRKVGISRKAYEMWLVRDADFAQLMVELDKAKRDYFESYLIKKVREGDTKAIIFANKTMNRDRGYGDKLVVEHTGKVNHNHTILNIEELGLPLDLRVKLMEHVRSLEVKQEQKALTDQSNIIDAEFEKVENEAESQKA